MRAVAALGVSALVATACGSSSHPPVQATMATGPVIAQTITRQHGISTTVVSCPAHPKMQAGYSFACVAKLAVGATRSSRRDDSSHGGVRYSNSTPLRVLNSHPRRLAIKRAVHTQRQLKATVCLPVADPPAGRGSSSCARHRPSGKRARGSR